MTRAREIAALVLIALAAATVLPEAGWNATAHYALVESLADGTPRIDDHLNQGGDIAWVDGHFYAAKSPGLAVASVPWYVVLDAAGARPDTVETDQGPPGARAVTDRAVWQLNLAVVAAFLALLLVMRAAVERLVPGTGGLVAAILGLGTLLLPFATQYFAHVLSALLGFAAFALLLRERQQRSTALVAVAGVLAGLAVVVEQPLALVAMGLGVYATVDRPRLRRALTYAGGVVLGVLPLLAYDTWAFGSPFRTGYSDAVLELGASGHDVIGANDEGFFGLTYPDLGALADLVVSERGLFVLTPVTLVALAGLWPLVRRGHRREALLVGALTAGFLLYNASYYLPFGGHVPGPRFLVPLLPFLALPLAAALARWPLITLPAACVSVFWMVSATVAGPLLPEDASPTSWVGDIVHDGDVADSILVNGRPAVVLFVSLGLAALLLLAPSLATIVRRAPTRES